MSPNSWFLSILLFIDRWLQKGFEDEEFKCSVAIKEFVLAIRGSSTMEVKAQEIASLIDNPDYVRRNRSSIDVATDQVF
jgi:hypothetical protein